MKLPIDVTFKPMEARVAAKLPPAGAFQFEPKWDGFRALCFRDGDEVALQSKSGQPLVRYFPEIAEAVGHLAAKRFVVDGELVVPIGDRLDFDQLLQRIHPAASRVAMLSRTQPAIYIVFDLLVDAKGQDIHELPLDQRRPLLERFAEKYLDGHERFRLSPATSDRKQAQEWRDTMGNALDGIIAKRLDVPYSSGDRLGMLKIKRMRTADCVIGGYRSAGASIGSLLLGLYDAAGKLDYVGHTSGLSAAEKKSLIGKLKALQSESAFTGRSPGGPSRWNRGQSSEWIPVKPELVLEVEYDHVTNGRFRHGTRPLRFRPDKAARQCTDDQLA